MFDEGKKGKGKEKEEKKPEPPKPENEKCSYCGQEIQPEDLETYYGKPYHKDCLEKYKKEKEEERKEEEEKESELDKKQSKQIEKLEEKMEKIEKKNKQIEQLEQKIQTLEEQNEESIEKKEKQIKDLKEQIEGLNGLVEEMNKEGEELLQKRLYLNEIIKAIEEEVEKVKLTNNEDLKDLYVSRFNSLGISDRIFELDFEKFKTEVMKLAEEKNDRNAVKVKKRLDSGRQFSFIAPVFQVINQYFLQRDNIHLILKDKYKNNPIIPIGLDSITQYIVGTYLNKRIKELEEHYEKELEESL